MPTTATVRAARTISAILSSSGSRYALMLPALERFSRGWNDERYRPHRIDRDVDRVGERQPRIERRVAGGREPRRVREPRDGHAATSNALEERPCERSPRRAELAGPRPRRVRRLHVPERERAIDI